MDIKLGIKLEEMEVLLVRLAGDLVDNRVKIAANKATIDRLDRYMDQLKLKIRARKLKRK